MKTFLLLLCLVVVGFSATLEWDRNPEPEVSGYNIWLQTTNGVTLLTNVATTTWTSSNITTRSRVGVSAVSTNGFESDISWGGNPAAPIRIRLTLQSSEYPTGPWKDETNAVLVADMTLSESRFYRAAGDISR